MNAATTSQVGRGVAAVRERIAAACARSGRDPRDVTLIAVSKTVDVAHVREAMAYGVGDFGENRVQEALPKLTALNGDASARWHFIGQLQRNKARAVAANFDAVHSVDSVALLEALERHATRPLAVFVQVNLTDATRQGGMAAADVPGLLAAARECQHCQAIGLMTIGRYSPDAEESRTVFAELAAMAREHGLHGLSMGMTNDYEVAIEEGATHIRVGRGIFGEREG